jgi:hypothetical protein
MTPWKLTRSPRPWKSIGETVYTLRTISIASNSELCIKGKGIYDLPCLDEFRGHCLCHGAPVVCVVLEAFKKSKVVAENAKHPTVRTWPCNEYTHVIVVKKKMDLGLDQHLS